jgi:hypothetical protein
MRFISSRENGSVGVCVTLEASPQATDSPDPSCLVAEPKERPHAFQVLRRGEGAVRPRLAELPDGVD